jgi:ceramide glucosyltransferase
MGKMFQHAGYPVRVARTVVSNVVAGATVPSFFERQLRWSMLRSRLRPLAYALEPVTSPLALLPLAWAVMGVWAFAWAPALLLLRDVGQSAALGGEISSRMLVASPLREVIGLLGWIHAPFRRHIAWRGHRVRLSSGSLAYVASRRTRGA